jgi:hypothetical protein
MRDSLQRPQRRRGADVRREQRFWVGWRRRSERNGAASIVSVDPPASDSQPGAATAETPLEKAARDVMEAEASVARQREMVFERRRNGQPTDDAEKILRGLQEILFEYRKLLATQQHRHRRGPEQHSAV